MMQDAINRGAIGNIRRAGIIGIALLAGVLHQGAAAETLTVRGVSADGNELPGEIELIQIEPLGGDLGEDLELALFDRLGNITIQGQPWFSLGTPRDFDDAVREVEDEDGAFVSETLRPDASVRGTARSDVFEREIDPHIETECVTRGENDECTEEREVRIECRRLQVRVEPRIQITGSDGGFLYSYSTPGQRTVDFCADEADVPSPLSLANDIIDEIASAVRFDVAPSQFARSPRIMERRRGLRREDRDAFRDAVRLTNSDQNAACQVFADLLETNPEHPSLLFNTGLCWEREGNYDQARWYYERTLAFDPGHDYPENGLSRVRGWILGQAILTARGWR